MKTIRTLLWVGLLALSLTVVATRAAEAKDQLRGDLAALPYDFCPAGWLPTDGSVLLIEKYPALFSAIGTRYGGDGRTTFALPNVDLNSVKLKVCILVDPTLSNAGV